jgi:hypothetical protein
MMTGQRYRPVGFFTPRESVVYGGNMPAPPSQPEKPRVIVRTLVIDLTTARTAVVFPITANAVWALYASHVDARLDLQYESGGLRSDAMPVTQGFKIAGGGLRVDRLLITNTAQAGKSITLGYFDDPNAGDVDFDIT